MRNIFPGRLASKMLVLSLIGLPTAIQPARAQDSQFVSMDSNYVLLPDPTAELVGEQSRPKITVELGAPGIASPSHLARWGDSHWLAELTPNGGGQPVWLSVEKSRFEPESFWVGVPIQLVSIGSGRIAHWDGDRLAWSEFPFRFDIATPNLAESVRIAKSLRSVRGAPRLHNLSGYVSDGLHTVTSLRAGIRVRSILKFQKTFGGLTATMLEGDPEALQKFGRAFAAFPQYPLNFTPGVLFRSASSWVGARSIGHWRMWFEEPGLLVFVSEDKFTFEDVENWVRTPISTLDRSIVVKTNSVPLEIGIDVGSFAQRATKEPRPDVWLDSPKISDFPVLLVGRSGSIQWEIRGDSDGALMSRFGTNVVALDGYGRQGWLTLGSSFAYVDSVKPGSGPWVLHVDGKPVRRVYPRKLRDGSLLIIVNGLAAPFPAASPEVQIIGANEEKILRAEVERLSPPRP